MTAGPQGLELNIKSLWELYLRDGDYMEFQPPPPQPCCRYEVRLPDA